MSPLAAIEVRDLNKRYGRIQALIDVSIDVQRQELFALLGPNGAGKTTLLHILCGLLEPDSGTVRIGGLDVFVQPARSRRTMGVVFQEPSLDDRLTVYENLNFHGLVYGIPRKLRQQRIDEMLELVELADWREKLVRTLSSGMKRRVELARALTHDANILFLDEPTVGLDAQSRERIWEYIGRLRSLRELTVVVTTHYIEEVEACDRVCVIDRGIILALNTPAALKVAHGQQLLRVVPREEATASEIMAAYPDTTLQRNAEIIIKSSGDAFAEAFLSRYGSRIRRLSVEEPSLESVFLSLTGREIREQAANPRERTLAFGRRGGEHTR
jgi:ABC-2 type transport system ATP-binding protein